MIKEYLTTVKDELKLTKKDFKLLLEAYRRKHLIDTLNPTDFLGLGTPAEYKSKYFTCANGRPEPRVMNWFILTNKGEAMMSKLEIALPVGKYTKFELNEFIFLY